MRMDILLRQHNGHPNRVNILEVKRRQMNRHQALRFLTSLLLSTIYYPAKEFALERGSLHSCT